MKKYIRDVTISDWRELCDGTECENCKILDFCTKLRRASGSISLVDLTTLKQVDTDGE